MKVKKMWSILLIMIFTLISCTNISFSQGIGNGLEKSNCEEILKNYIEDFLVEGYSEYYDINDVKVIFDEVDVDESSNVEFIAKATMNSVLKAKCVEELPYVKGMLERVNLNTFSYESDDNTINMVSAANKSNLSDRQIEVASKIIIDKIKDLEQYIGQADDTNFIFKITASVKDGEIDISTLKMFAENIDEFIPAEEILPKNSQELEKEGFEYLETEISESVIICNEEILPNLYSGYDRIAARDYANKYTSNTTKQCPHGKALMDTSKYNSNYNWYCHNDCANYVSQSLKAGGLPTDSTWKAGSTAWVNCESLTNYMVSTKKYWKKSDYENANAGGVIMMKNSDGHRYHTVMIVKNDTVTRQFSGHTNDRLKTAYSKNSNWEYYVLQ
ncbi:amidase domain-containing protein [Sporanaerobacter acetigenes]|uniref:RNA polymerase sigma-70 factor, ECF subfamily n=1 Tax=Sporanaerobacter acetigenes DSM 13106 TaxID=1123281 RepID=A0A1M5YU36_9FIRM|nr:amidase domain-containing protein [Sporanaerobacter acetigenes]SHI15334.1 RNA polymerase sigma-70 factor, ECF subfamily [Sporanaerobacter acetigenes DSM 13106]